MKVYVILNQTTVEKAIAKEKRERKDGVMPSIHRESEAESLEFDSANGAARVFFFDKAEAEKHLKFLCLKYPHLSWALLSTDYLQQADIPMRTAKVTLK